MQTVSRTPMDWALNAPVAARAASVLTGRTLLDRAAAAFFAATILVIALYTWVRPDYNWDMVAYVATALENRIEDPAELHRETWAQISPGARPSQLYEIQQGNPYNVHQWNNPVDFESQLSMYRVKVAYVSALRALEPVFGLVGGALFVSIASLVGIGALALRWLGEERALQSAFVLAPVLVIADLTHMSTAITPDILMALISLLAIHWLLKGRDWAAGAALLLSVLVRPDNIILVFALLIAAVAFGWRKLPMAVTFAASFVACLLVSKLGGHPGWWAHFYFSCVQIQNSMIGFHPDFSLFDFAHGYVRGILVSLLDNDWPALLALFLAGWVLLARGGRMGTGRENALMFALAIGTLGKFASFPLPDDRFYFAFMAGMAIILATRWNPRFDRLFAKETTS